MASQKKPCKPKAKKAKKPESTTAMFPDLHEDIENALSAEGTIITPKPTFNPTEDHEERIAAKETYIMGRFQCRNRTCPKKGWGSKKIFIVIQRFPDNGYNAVVFKQCCSICEELGIMRINENSYVERVMYWLKKWAGIYIEEDNRERKKGPPHEEDLCEGCKVGLCQRGRNAIMVSPAFT